MAADISAAKVKINDVENRLNMVEIDLAMIYADTEEC